MENMYDAIFIINSEDENKIKETIERINNILLSKSCKINSKQEKGIKKLAYEIKGFKQGYYYYVNFKNNGTDDNLIGKISIIINTIDEVIKYIFLKISN